MFYHKPKPTAEDRLIAEALRLMEEANKLPPGPMRDAILRNSRQIKIAVHLDNWLFSPGLRPPQ